MSEDNNPLSKLNLPAILLGPAGEAISKLVGIPLEMLRARLERPQKAIEARSEAQKAFQIELAKEMAKQAAADPALADRAMAAFARDLRTKQENREAVAHAAIEILAAPQPNGSSAEGDRAGDQPSDDWLNFFGAYAEKASSDNMRKLWSALLAGEIRKPGAYAILTLRVLAELDTLTAKMFEASCNVVINKNWLPLTDAYLQERYATLAALSERGLLRPHSLTEHLVAHLDNNGLHVDIYPGGRKGLVVRGEPGKNAMVRGIGVQRVGQEILTLLAVEPHPDLTNMTVEAYDKSHIVSISEADLRPLPDSRVHFFNERVIWKK